MLKAKKILQLTFSIFIYSLIKMKYCFLLLVFFTSSLYSIVIVESDVNKKNIYSWQSVDYTIDFEGDLDSFNAEGIDEKSINDFEVINKKIVSEIIQKDNEKATLKHKIIYSLKPIRKGKLTIPSLEVKYFAADSDNNFKQMSKEAKEYKISVFGFGFLFIIIAQWVVIILVAFLIYFKVVKKLKK